MVNIKTTEELVSEVKYNFVVNIDTFNDMNVGSALDVYTTSICQEINVLYDSIQTLEDNAFIDTSEGTYLDQIGLEAGFVRNPGSKASGTITFLRNSPATTDFIIPANSQISTQPNEFNEQIVFETTISTTFKSVIVDETQNYLDGIFFYKPSQRDYENLTSITGTYSSSPYTFVVDSDFQITDVVDKKVIDISTLNTLDDCEATTDWTTTGVASATTTNATIYRQGTKALDLLKSNTSSTSFGYEKTLGSVEDLSVGDVFMYVYIADFTTLAKLDTITLYLGNSGAITNSFELEFEASELNVGWNILNFPYSSQFVIRNGIPNIAIINHLRIDIESLNITDTFSTGELLMDFWYNAEYNVWSGQAIEWLPTGTKPDTGTELKYSYTPLSVDITCTGVEVGTDYNVNKNTVIYKISNLTNIDGLTNYEAFTGGVAIESDDAFRERIKEGNAIDDVATVSALEATVKTLSFVKTVSVIDLPVVSVTNEEHTYNSSITTYGTYQQVPIDNTNLTIGDTPGGSDYTKDVDFILTANGEIEWQGVSTPTDTNPFYLDYDRYKLGYFNVLVTGVSGTLSASQLTEIENLLDEKKSAGILYTITQPTEISIAVEVTPTISAGYTSTTVKEDVATAIENYIFTLDIGEDVLIAKLIQTIMAVEGVSNVVINDVNGGVVDITIDSDEIAINGTHTVN